MCVNVSRVRAHGRDSRRRPRQCPSRPHHISHVTLRYGLADAQHRVGGVRPGRLGGVPGGARRHRLAGGQQFLRPDQAGRVRRRERGRRSRLLGRRRYGLAAAAAAVVTADAGKYPYA